MLKEIYREIIKQEHDTVVWEGLVDDLIDQFAKPYKEQLSDRDIETLKAPYLLLRWKKLGLKSEQSLLSSCCGN